jgi:5-methylcytosine-specific restriction endonuclease McrA
MPKIRTKQIKRPLCGCGRPVHYQSKTINGFYVWKTGCQTCQNKAVRFRKDHCEKCGSKEKLNIDHIDGDTSNNDIDNLMTLCQPCHVMKTTAYDEWRKK